MCAALQPAPGSRRALEVHLSAYEVYCERVLDLLAAERPGPTTASTPGFASAFERQGSASAFQRSGSASASAGPGAGAVRVREVGCSAVYLDGLTAVKLTGDGSGAIELLRRAVAHRAVGGTDANRSSSRSHAVVLLSVRTALGVSVLTLADLAGSERCAKTSCDGQRLVEARSINRSISALGNCIAALARRPRGHVPFRDSTITRLLARAIGGDAHTTVCVTLSPALSSYEENCSTMLFASRARAVRIAPRGLDGADREPLASEAPSLEAGPEGGTSPRHAIALEQRVPMQPRGWDEPQPLSADERRDLRLIGRLRAEMTRDAFLAAAAARDAAFNAQRAGGWSPPRS
jgi:hypothetical protein